ncbi:MAG: SPOR domain-containing protein [Sulfuricurvum sp.]|nr:SPOR domain-containing protein [Sulfuricurvum sp.]MDD5386484.1 SPOR domain-containing protein [Sulfuricurvum sp.]
MEEKNELNDIILNKGGSSSGSKKLLLAIATLTLILIIVLVIMNSLKNDEVQKAPQAILPPEPSAPTEIINDPLFEPVEVIQEGNESAKNQTLDQVAQKIKEESLQNVPSNAPAVVQAAPTVTTPAKTTVHSAPIAKTVSIPMAQKSAPEPKPVVQKVYAQPTIAKVQKAEPKTLQTEPVKQEPKKVAQPKIAPKSATEVKAPETTTQTPKAAEPKTEVKATPIATNSGATYYVQVGSFSKEPSKALIDRLNASGMKYTAQKTGETTKILVGPFQGEKAVQDAMDNIRQNIEAKAFKIKG